MGTSEPRVSINETDHVIETKDLAEFSKEAPDRIEPVDIVEAVLYKFVLLEMKARFMIFLSIGVLIIMLIT